jgi:hypothetical protein
MNNRVVLDEDDPYIEHVMLECSAYLCDIVAYMNLRYSPKVANDVIRMLKLRMSRDHEQWETYVERTAPSIVDETRQMLGLKEV